MKQFKLFSQKSPKISNFVFEKKEHQNSGTLDKDTINNWIITILSVKKKLPLRVSLLFFFSSITTFVVTTAYNPPYPHFISLVLMFQESSQVA